MLKVTVLIPTRCNSGYDIPLPTIDNALSNLRDIAGGFTNERYMHGEYTMDDGNVALDTCIKVWVVIDTPAKLNELREWASKLCVACKQESIYFESHEVDVEFIRGMSKSARAADVEQSDREYIAARQSAS
jgi:hypothetical protein